MKVIVRSPFETMKASPWEKEDAMHEDIPIIDNHVPKSFVIENGRLVGMTFDKVEAVYDENGNFKPNVGAKPLRGEIDTKSREQLAADFPEVSIGITGDSE